TYPASGDGSYTGSSGRLNCMNGQGKPGPRFLFIHLAPAMRPRLIQPMSSTDVQERARMLRRERVPFEHARVIRAEKPTAARPGDEAVVLPGGAIEGFIGGTCAEATVRAQALALLDAGGTRMLRISPQAETRPDLPPDTVLAHNPCLSGGALEIFLEAVVP